MGPLSVLCRFCAGGAAALVREACRRWSLRAAESLCAVCWRANFSTRAQAVPKDYLCLGGMTGERCGSGGGCESPRVGRLAVGLFPRDQQFAQHVEIAAQNAQRDVTLEADLRVIPATF